MMTLILASLSLVSFNCGWECKWEDESAWRKVKVPHDAHWSRPYDKAAGWQQGYAKGGIVTYRKRFAPPEGPANARYAVRFDGAYADAKVRLNGRPAGGCHNGYVPFEVELTDLEATNVLEVVCDARTQNARWYVGAGLLRDVWLVCRAGFALEPERVSVGTKVEGRDARVRFEVEDSEVVDPKDGELVLKNVELWSPERPRLYAARVTARNAAGETDTAVVRFGVKTIEFTRDRGLLLNGRPYPLHGICQHENYGCLGGALNRAALKRQLSKLKPMGVNAIRTVHNPFAPAFYELCDEMGFLVMDELFDEWEKKKSDFGYWRYFAESALDDLEKVVRRDRNHASLLMWSVGNEIADMAETGAAGERARGWTRRLAAAIRKLDPHHPVTTGCCAPEKADLNGCLAELDVVGLNYNLDYYLKFKGKYCLYGSETTAVPATRDTYLFRPTGDGRLEIVGNRGLQQSSYSASRFNWASGVEDSLRIQRESPWSAGEFSWSSYDYQGEPMVPNLDYRLPTDARSSFWGVHDLAGFRKDRFYLQQAAWTVEPMAHLLPDWTLPGLEGRRVPVWCYTNCREAELFLNGVSCGVRRRADTADDHLAWEVPYAPGVLEVRAKGSNGVTVVDVRRTAGPFARFRVTEDFRSGGWTFFRVDAVDAQGTVLVSCDDRVAVAAQNGRIVATDNGDPADRTPFASATRRLYHGSLLVVAKAADAEGLVLTVRGDRPPR